MKLSDLNGKVCLVTGASRGIGAAAALGLAEHGAKVAVHYRSSRLQAEEIVRKIEEAGGSALAIGGDIAERQVLDSLIEQTARAFGRLDVLINNAGDQIVRKTVTETPDELFDKHIAVNVWPTFAACRAGVRQFRAQGGGGNIINVTSVAARTGGGGGSTLYAGSKAFISTFTRSLAKEVVGEGIRVNAVSPGVIATDMQDRVTTPEQLSGAVASIPMKRAGEADECLGAFLYLASDKLSSYVTGQVIEVNGGILMP